MVPNRSWGGDGLLGMIIRYHNMESANLDTVHILDVHPGSPAEKAGLQAYSDYLLGTSEVIFRGMRSSKLLCSELRYFDRSAVLKSHLFLRL